MIVCDYCGKDCSSDHADFKLEAYRWDYNGYHCDTQNTLHLHKGCHEEVVQAIRLKRISNTLIEAEHMLKLNENKEEQE